jgi:hypothetical protein
MESEYPKRNTPRTPVKGMRKQTEKSNFKETGKRWKKPTTDRLDGSKPGVDKQQELKMGWRHPLRG